MYLAQDITHLRNHFSWPRWRIWTTRMERLLLRLRSTTATTRLGSQFVSRCRLCLIVSRPRSIVVPPLPGLLAPAHRVRPLLVVDRRTLVPLLSLLRLIQLNRISHLSLESLHTQRSRTPTPLRLRSIADIRAKTSTPIG